MASKIFDSCLLLVSWGIYNNSLQGKKISLISRSSSTATRYPKCDRFPITVGKARMARTKHDIESRILPPLQFDSRSPRSPCIDPLRLLSCISNDLKHINEKSISQENEVTHATTGSPFEANSSSSISPREGVTFSDKATAPTFP